MFATLIAMGLPSGCQKDNTTAPEEPGLRIGDYEVAQASLGPGESTEVRVWVVDGDPPVPVEGVEVKFSETTAPAAGSFSKDAELSDATGWVTVTYQPSPGIDGVVYLRIEAGTDKEYPEIQVGTATQTGTSLVLTTNTGQSSVAADGQSSVAMTLTVTEGLSAAPVANATVTLRAGDQFVDLDGDGVFTGTDQLVSSGDLNGNGLWDAEGSLPEQVHTDTNGKAIFIYDAGDHEGTVYIKATVDGASEDFPLFQHPTSLQVTAEVGTRELLANGISQTTVMATVGDWSGNATNGIILYFVAGEPFTDVGGDGYFTAGEDTYEDTNANGQWDAIGAVESVATTGADGVAWVTYTSGLTEGTVTFRATSSSGSAVTTLELVPVPQADEVVLSLVENTLPADGVSSVTGSVTVKRTDGPVVGKRVLLVAGDRFEDNNGDGSFTPGVDLLLTDADGNLSFSEIGSLPSEVFTDENGVATFIYQAGLDPATAWVRATADGVGAEASIELQDLPTAWSIELVSSEDVLAVQGAGGVDNARILARAFDSRGATVPAGIEIDFTLLSGPSGGEVVQGAVSGVYTARTNENGEAEAVLSAGTIPGLITVEASSGATRRTVAVSVGAGLSEVITARTLDAEIGFWATTTVEAVVQDGYGNAVEDGTVVQFTVDEGLIVGQDGPGVTHTVGGKAVAEYQSLGPSATTDNVAEISITVPNTAASATLDLPLIAPTGSLIDVLELVSSHVEIAPQGATGDEEAVLTLQASDNQGRAVGAGYEVSFSIIHGPNGGENLNGLGWGPIVLVTNESGRASVVLRSGNDSGPIEVEAMYESITTSVEVGMASQDIAAIECEDVCSALEITQDCIVSVLVYDQHHDAVPDGTVVWFSATAGLINGTDGGGTSLTENGRATASYHASQSGQVTITAKTADGHECNTLVDVGQEPEEPQEVTNLVVTVAAQEIGVSGTGSLEQTLVSAQGFDLNGNTVGVDVEVTFRIVQGPGGGETFLNSTGPVVAKTGPSGVATVSLAAGTVSGTVVVEALAGLGVSQATSIAIAAGPPANIYVGIGACNVLACSRVNVENSVVSVVSDIYNNPVKDGTVVYYTVDKGVIHGDESGGLGSDVTLNGVAGGIWRSGDSCEYVTVTASTDGGLVLGSSSFIASDVPYSAEILTPINDVVELAADGERELTIWTEILDYNGMYVLPAELDWEVEFGEIIEPGESGDGCASSVAKSIYKSTLLDRDWSVTTPDDGIGAVDHPTVSTGFGGISDFVTVNLLTSVANADESEVELSGAATPNGTIGFTVTIKDRYGNPLGGHTIEGSASGGSISTITSTDLWGQATGFFTAPSATGEVTLTFVDTDPNFGGLILVEVASVN